MFVQDMKIARKGKAAGGVASRDPYCCYVVFVFSIGVWGAKLARNRQSRESGQHQQSDAASVKCSFCVLYWCLEHKSGQNRQGCESSQLQQSPVVSVKCSFCVLYWCLGHKNGQNRQGCESGQLEQSHVVSVIQFLCSLLVFGTRKWPELARLRERLFSIESYFSVMEFLCCLLIFGTRKWPEQAQM